MLQHQGLPATDDLGALPDVDWRSRLLARGCTERLGAGDGRDTHAHISGRFHFTDDFLVSETILSPSLPLNDPLGTHVCV